MMDENNLNNNPENKEFRDFNDTEFVEVNEENSVEFPKYSEVKVKKKRPVLVLIGVIVCFAILATLVIGSFTVLKLFEKGYLGNNKNGSASVDYENLPEVSINVTNKPQTNDIGVEPDANGKYTTEQITKLLKPSVVGVVTYSMQTFQQLGEGTGIVTSEDGYIITNAHVISDADSVKVILSDETEYEAKVIGSDSKTDLAVLKIDAKGLTAATFGNSEEAVIGEEVIAIGNAAGLFGSVTKGIISELNRDISDNGYGLKAIQTDAAINPGNSGGPLVNMYGQVIGITSSKYVGTGYEGIGFAISIDEALPIVKQLVSYGYVTDRAKLGIEYTFISESSAYMYGLKSGLYVKTIDQDCAVSKSELKVYDIITEIDGVEMNTTEAVSDIMAGKKPGDTIEVTVYRFASNVFGGRFSTTKGETLTFEITLSEDKGELN